MRITISAEAFAQQRTVLYNIIKRHQEDLKRRIPALQEFVLEFINHPPVNVRNFNGLAAKHTLDQKEELLTLQIYYMFDPSPENIQKCLLRELASIKELYY